MMVVLVSHQSPLSQDDIIFSLLRMYDNLVRHHR